MARSRESGVHVFNDFTCEISVLIAAREPEEIEAVTQNTGMVGEELFAMGLAPIGFG